jgi:methylated-DNA-[protein]-cysteine S-methyltransferase
MTADSISFSDRVYIATQQIPEGYVTTYGQLARYIGSGSARAVGQALRRNPYAPEVPCHRVVNASYELHGFKGSKESITIHEKRLLLEEEGVRFSPNGKVDQDCVFTFSGHL